jgi:hypothetical protein
LGVIAELSQVVGGCLAATTIGTRAITCEDFDTSFVVGEINENVEAARAGFIHKAETQTNHSSDVFKSRSVYSGDATVLGAMLFDIYPDR